MVLVGWTSPSYAEYNLGACVWVEANANIQRGNSNDDTIHQNGGVEESHLKKLGSTIRSFVEENMVASIGNNLDLIQSPLLNDTLGLFLPMKGTQNPSNPMAHFSVKLLELIRKEIVKLNIKTNFNARVSIIPVEMCNYLDKLVESRPLTKQAKSEETLLKKLKNGPLSLPKSQSLRFPVYAKWLQDKERFNFAGLTLDIGYTAIKAKNKRQPLKVGELNVPPFDLRLSGGIVITLPENFAYRLETPLYMSKPLPNIIIKDVFFEKKTGDQNQKHFVLLNFNNLLVTEKGIKVRHDKKYGSVGSLAYDDLKLDLYFSDKVDAIYSYEDRKIIFSPNLDNPIRSLITQVLTDDCDNKMKNGEYKQHSFFDLLIKGDFQNLYGLSCDQFFRINLGVNHLILEMSPVLIKRHAEDKNPIQTFVPKIRAPKSELNEKGGINFIARRFAPLAVDTTHREGIFSVSLNNLSIVDDGIDAVYSQIFGLAASNAAFVRGIMESLDENYCKNNNPQSHLIDIDKDSAQEIPQLDCDRLLGNNASMIDTSY